MLMNTGARNSKISQNESPPPDQKYKEPKVVEIVNDEKIGEIISYDNFKFSHYQCVSIEDQDIIDQEKDLFRKELKELKFGYKKKESHHSLNKRNSKNIFDPLTVNIVPARNLNKKKKICESLKDNKNSKNTESNFVEDIENLKNLKIKNFDPDGYQMLVRLMSLQMRKKLINFKIDLNYQYGIKMSNIFNFSDQKREKKENKDSSSCIFDEFIDKNSKRNLFYDQNQRKLEDYPKIKNLKVDDNIFSLKSKNCFPLLNNEKFQNLDSSLSVEPLSNSDSFNHDITNLLQISKSDEIQNITCINNKYSTYTINRAESFNIFEFGKFTSKINKSTNKCEGKRPIDSEEKIKKKKKKRLNFFKMCFCK